MRGPSPTSPLRKSFFEVPPPLYRKNPPNSFLNDSLTAERFLASNFTTAWLDWQQHWTLRVDLMFSFCQESSVYQFRISCCHLMIMYWGCAWMDTIDLCWSTMHCWSRMPYSHQTYHEHIQVGFFNCSAQISVLNRKTNEDVLYIENFMEQNLWLAAHHFSFWYWKLGGTVKKTIL